MAFVHFVLQKKGGVGKSLISSILTQYLTARSNLVRGYDTDPSNKSFSEFTELNVTKIDILDSNQEIDSRLFDTLVEYICSINEFDNNGHAVIDTGASCFVSLLAYLKQSEALSVIRSQNNDVMLHVPITGGSDIIHTVDCFAELATIFSDYPIILWLNQYHGELAFEGKSFEDFNAFKNSKNSIGCFINIPNKQKATFGKDIEQLMAKKITFVSSFNSNMPLMVRQRLKTFWNEMCAEIDNLSSFIVPKDINIVR
jgi:hypothetical protein